MVEHLSLKRSFLAYYLLFPAVILCLAKYRIDFVSIELGNRFCLCSSFFPMNIGTQNVLCHIVLFIKAKARETTIKSIPLCQRLKRTIEICVYIESDF